MKKKRNLVLGALTTAVVALGATGVGAAPPTVDGPMAFEPISGSAYGQLSEDWTEPFVVPEGFTQVKVSDESDFDIYAGQQDLADMNTVNETGPEAGRYLYRTHEVGDLGAVSVIDLRGEHAPKILVQEGDPAFPEITSATDLDGLRWTPWGTLLFAEEELEEPVVGGQDSGHVYEITLDPHDPMTAVDVKDRPQIGRLRHEGIEVGADGAVYVIDELNGGSIFKFVPTHRGDLSEGQLFALKIAGLTDADQKYSWPARQHVGSFEWVALDMEDAVVNANQAADAVAATEYGRPEDVEIIGQTLYVANTSEDRVIAIDLNRQVVSTYVRAGLNVPVENAGLAVTGFNNPDNLAEGPDGQLWMVEDNLASDIWVADRGVSAGGAATGASLFASLKDRGSYDGSPEAAEGTGIYFGRDARTLFVNVQHAAKELGDGTWMITKR